MTEKEFVAKLLTEFSKHKIKAFPDSFLNTDKLEMIDLPDKIFIPGNKFFDQFEIISVDGENMMQFDNPGKCKYIVYASRNSCRPIYIPKEIEVINEIITTYEKYVDSIIIKIQKEFREAFPNSSNLNKITNQIINKLNLARY